jgi:hypothetical protein
MELSNEAKPSFGTGFSAVLRIFTSPSSVYPQIRAGLSIWPALIVIMIFSALLSVLNTPYEEEAGMMMMTTMVERGVLPEAALEEQAERGSTPAWQGVLKGGLGAPAGIILVAFFYWLIMLIFFGGVSFIQTFCLTIYVSFIGILYRLVNYLYLEFADVEITSIRDLVLDLSPAVLFGDSNSFFVLLISSLSIFAIWGLVLTINGFSILVQRPWQKVLIPTLIIAMLGYLIQTTFLWFAVGQIA